MKVVCESCQTRYAISDDKVRGKTFKIKCKKCGAFMIVRPPEGEHDAPATSSEPALHAVESAPDSAPVGAGVDDDPEKETRVFNYAEFERLIADKPDEGAPAAVASGRVADAGAAEWYLLLGEDQVGPLTHTEVEDRIRRGDANSETFAWREGLVDWRPVREVEALAPFLATSSHPHHGLEEEATRAEIPRGSPRPSAPLRASPYVAHASAESERPSYEGASAAHVPSLFDASVASMPARATGPVAGSPSATKGFGSAAYGSPAVATGASLASAGAMPEPERKMTGQRHEDSVLFSLKSLGVVNFKDGDDAARAKVVEPSGMRAAPTPLGASAGAMGSPRALDVPLPPPMMVPVRRGMASGTKIAVAVIVLLLLLGGGAVTWFLTREEKPSVARNNAPADPRAPLPPASPPPPSSMPVPALLPAQPSQPPTALAMAPSAPVAPAPTPPTAAPAAVEEEEEVVESGRRVKKKKKKKAAGESPSRPVVVARAPSAPVVESPAPSAPEPASEPVAAPEPTPEQAPAPARPADREVQAILEGKAPTRAPPETAKKEEALPDTLEKSQIKGVIRRNTSSIIRCYNTKVADKGGVKGSLNVTFTIFGTGRTGGIRVQRPDFWGSEFVGCAGNAVSRWKFPRFKGEEIEITYPFVLGGF